MSAKLAVIHYQVPSKPDEKPVVSTVPVRAVRDVETGAAIKLPAGMQAMAGRVGRFSTACRQPFANPEGDGFTTWSPMVNCPDCKATDEYKAEAARIGRKA